MGKIVMTLLVRRKPRKKAVYPYAAQIVFPRELSHKKTTLLASVRLIDKSGRRASVLRSLEFYHPEEWRAATLSEQAHYAANFNGNPRPWYCVMYSTGRNVFDYSGSGDKETNNGQHWAIEDLESDWKVEARRRQNREEEQGAEWDRRLAKWGEND